mmetsp:Transcript_65397/g.141284  ORF Transcript_65397/g.141284 Transcript_65397/m.141284 type:complete len:301 (-) Transcript_65397:58-960(-)
MEVATHEEFAVGNVPEFPGCIVGGGRQDGLAGVHTHLGDAERVALLGALERGVFAHMEPFNLLGLKWVDAFRWEGRRACELLLGRLLQRLVVTDVVQVGVVLLFQFFYLLLQGGRLVVQAVDFNLTQHFFFHEILVLSDQTVVFVFKSLVDLADFFEVLEHFHFLLIDAGEIDFLVVAIFAEFVVGGSSFFSDFLGTFAFETEFVDFFDESLVFALDVGEVPVGDDVLALGLDFVPLGLEGVETLAHVVLEHEVADEVVDHFHVLRHLGRLALRLHLLVQRVFQQSVEIVQVLFIPIFTW